MSVKLIPFGCLPSGEKVDILEIENENGMRLQILTLGAVLHRLYAPDRFGKLADVTLGQNNVEECWKKPIGVGMVVGRCANRISDAMYTDIGHKILLEENAPEMTLHSASGNYGRHIFAPDELDKSGSSVTLALHDDGWAGFPGQVDFSVTYTLTQENTLRIEYKAQCTERTVMNPTHHMYLNLAGQGNGMIDQQLLQIDADYFLPAAKNGLPTGEVRSLKESALDARKPVPFANIFNANDADIYMFGGMDHNYCLRGRGFRRAGSVTDPGSGRRVTVYTDMPGMQVYTMNGLPHSFSGKDGAEYVSHGAVCLETQQYPNAVNYSHFPSPIIEAGNIWHSVTEYHFDSIG